MQTLLRKKKNKMLCNDVPSNCFLLLNIIGEQNGNIVLANTNKIHSLKIHKELYAVVYISTKKSLPGKRRGFTYLL